MLLYGPPSGLMVIKPGIEVNHVIDEPATKTQGRRPDLHEERDPDPEISRCLLTGKAARPR